jgi:predicted metal-dependent hydrolase
MHQIKVSNFEIDVVRKDIKNLHLAVYPPNGRIRIAAPLNINDEAVRLFAISKLSWIKKHQANFDAQERQTKRECISGESHYYNGKRYLLNVIYHKGVPKVELRRNTYLDLYVREGSSKEQRGKVLKEWYRARLKERIPALIDKWQKTIGVEISDWGVKLMKTKWGTCNIEAKRIWLNLELAKKPIHCLEYIIVHEMLHLLERHHNETFVAYMDKFVPNWKFFKDELNKYPLSHIERSY